MINDTSTNTYESSTSFNYDKWKNSKWIRPHIENGIGFCVINTKHYKEWATRLKIIELLKNMKNGPYEYK